MTQQDNTSKAYALADEWISIILSTSPELLVEKVVVYDYQNSKGAFNFQGVVDRAKALAEFRQQLGNALAAQHFPAQGD